MRRDYVKHRLLFLTVFHHGQDFDHADGGRLADPSIDCLEPDEAAAALPGALVIEMHDLDLAAIIRIIDAVSRVPHEIHAVFHEMRECVDDQLFAHLLPVQAPVVAMVIDNRAVAGDDGQPYVQLLRIEPHLELGPTAGQRVFDAGIPE